MVCTYELQTPTHMQKIRYHSIYTYVQINKIKCKILIDKPPPASPWHGIRITLTGWHSFCFQNIYECTSKRAKTILNSLQSGCMVYMQIARTFTCECGRVRNILCIENNLYVGYSNKLMLCARSYEKKHQESQAFA